jgi:hypothetical protein
LSGYNRLVTNGPLTEADWNENIDALELLGIYVLGRGIISGLGISAGVGLALTVAAGKVNTLKPASLSGFSYNVPDNQTSYIWMDNEGTCTATTSTTYPGGNVVCLGKVVAAAGSISSVSTDNRDELVRMESRGVLRIGKDLTIDTLTGAVKHREGTNAIQGVATLVAGTVTVNTTRVTANSRIFLTGQNASGTHGELGVSARVAGTSFTITSSNGADTRDVAWYILEPQ